MPVEVVPNRIELSQVQGGYFPDALESDVPLDGSPDATNLLPAPGGAIEVRNGFTRLSAGRLNALEASHWIRHVNYYETIDGGNRKRYLMCVLSSGAAAANNVRVYAYDLDNDTFTRVDTAGVTWAQPNFEHWYAVIEGTYWGGVRGNAIYSWHPTEGWNATATTPSADTWVDSITPGAGEKARNYAYKRGQQVKLSGSYYKAARNIRFKTWEDGNRYSKGERVSRKASESGQTYWRSFECIKSHTAGTDNDQPGTGASTATYWKRVRLSNILDDDSDVTADWFLNPVARKSSVGAYHGNRLFVRTDDDDNWSRVQYSAPAKPEKDSDIADLDFNGTNWAPVDSLESEGGGWFNVPFAGRGDQIRGFFSFGNYLIICGRWQSYVLSGTNENTWTLRRLGDFGACSQNSIAELDGLVYMLGRQGNLAMTDGTQMKAVPGLEKIREYLKEQTDNVVDSETNNFYPSLLAHNGLLFIAFPQPDTDASVTIVYNPVTQSFWKTSLRIMDMARGADSGTERMWFSTAIDADAGQSPCVFEYKDDPGNETYTDDDWQASSGSAATDDISYHWRTAWFQFGTTRQERRIRRVWALVSGEASQSVVFRVFKNFINGSSSYVTTVTRTLTGMATRNSEFIEAKVGQTGHTSYATSLRISGTTNARTGIHGIGIDTEPIRTRFKRG